MRRGKGIRKRFRWLYTESGPFSRRTVADVHAGGEANPGGAGGRDAGVGAGAVADLALTARPPASPVSVGADAVYSLTIKNNGPATADRVVLIDILPAGVVFVSARSSQGTCSGTPTITCAIPALANGASADVTIVVRPKATGTWVDKATVVSRTPDPNAANNSTTVASALAPWFGEGPR